MNGNGHRPASSGATPLHVAIIMDGNGRWAEARGLPRSAGHQAGRAAVGRTITAALAHGVSVLTLFTFSTDNWKRPENEVAELMRTFEKFFRVDTPALSPLGVQVAAIGRRDRLPLPLREAIDNVESAIRVKLHVRFAIDYSGQDAILEAARRFRRAGDDSAETFARLLAEPEGFSAPVPDVDLLIRTGGEQRLSNCPLWEIAYAELHFTGCLWPDFGPAELKVALEEFGKRQRRFGRIPAAAL
jgi:undecaprenyl diphosphate synthase